MGEKTYDIVKAYATGEHRHSIAVTVPVDVRKEVGIEEGERFLVKVDEGGRIILEPVEKG